MQVNVNLKNRFAERVIGFLIMLLIGTAIALPAREAKAARASKPKDQCGC